VVLPARVKLATKAASKNLSHAGPPGTRPSAITLGNGGRRGDHDVGMNKSRARRIISAPSESPACGPNLPPARPGKPLQNHPLGGQNILTTGIGIVEEFERISGDPRVEARNMLAPASDLG
jgi:hypothetical protein